MSDKCILEQRFNNIPRSSIFDYQNFIKALEVLNTLTIKIIN